MSTENKRQKTEHVVESEAEEEEEDEEEVTIDLNDKEYVGFIVPATSKPEMPLCTFMTVEDLFSFRAVPLKKKVTFEEAKKLIKCDMGQFVVVKPHLKKYGVRQIIVDEEGRCPADAVFNVDASALALAGLNSPLFGDVVFLKYK
jgi:hypothetical protein